MQLDPVIQELPHRCITSVTPYSTHYLHLRYYDGEKLEWYDTLNFDHPTKDYLVRIEFQNWARTNRSEITVTCPILNHTFILTHYQLTLYVILEHEFDDSSMILIQVTDEMLYSKIQPFVH